MKYYIVILALLIFACGCKEQSSSAQNRQNTNVSKDKATRSVPATPNYKAEVESQKFQYDTKIGIVTSLNNSDACVSIKNPNLVEGQKLILIWLSNKQFFTEATILKKRTLAVTLICCKQRIYLTMQLNWTRRS